jgi:DNA-binding MarR family transcriptional regulator
MHSVRTLDSASPAEALANSAAFLVSKLGVESTGRYKRRLEPLGLEPLHSVLLRYIASGDGLSQQALADVLGLARSRMVVLIDDLELRGLVERRPSPSDRRAYALHLTSQGRKLLGRVIDVASDHEEEFCAPLDPGERAHLVTLLQRLAAEQDIPLNVHPGLADRAGRPRGARQLVSASVAPDRDGAREH